MASIKLKGDTSGEVTISSPAVAGTTTLELPATSSTLATENALGVRNLIINGDMRIAQRATSKTGITAVGYHTVDRFQTNLINIGTWTQSQSTDVPSGQGFANSLKMDCTTADASPAAGDYLLVIHKIEGQNLQHLKKGTSSAEKITLSFWVRCSDTGDLQVNIRDIDNSRIIASTYTINTANTWEKKTITFDGDTTGTIDNDNASSFQIEWWLDSGTTFSSGSVPTTWQSNSNANRNAGATINLADSTSNDWYITGVQLEVGDTATPFEHRPYDMELARCQRYYFKLNPNNIRYAMICPTAYTRSSTTVDLALSFPVTMRDKPSSVSFSTIIFRRYDGSLVGGSFSALSLDTNTITPYNALLNATVSTGTPGHTGSVICNNNVNGYLAISAEL